MQQLLAAILHLGNVSFVESDSQDGASVTADSSATLADAALFWGVDVGRLSSELITKTIKTRGEVFNSPLSVQDAGYARDALAKAAYRCRIDPELTRIDP